MGNAIKIKQRENGSPRRGSQARGWPWDGQARTPGPSRGISMALMETRSVMNVLYRPAGNAPVVEVDARDFPHCGGEIQIHQPDFDLPRRLLVTCDDCKAWFVTGPTRSRYRWVFDGGRKSQLDRHVD